LRIREKTYTGTKLFLYYFLCSFIANRKKFYLISGIGFLISFLVFFFVPKNYGIDMTGGLQIEYSVSAPVESGKLDEVREDILKNYLI
jgi:preprotein translocase subunit SecF